MIIQMEGAVILQILNPSIQDLDHIKESIQGLSSTGEQKQANEKILEQASSINQNKSYEQFWSLYSKEKQKILMLVNRELFDRYTPTQIRISIENALKKLNCISVIGCEGYIKMKKIAGRKL